jgi:hypothetical protein
MYKLTLILIFLLCARLTLYAELPVDFFIQSEYKKDTVDYSDITTYYYREKLSILFSKESALNSSYIYLEQEKDYKYTWNLILNDISSGFSLITGNYFTHFGSGLLIGKKRIYDPDIFAFRISENDFAEYKPAFTPCNTGNPVFAFNGLGSSFRWQTQETKFALNTFYSIKERFIDEESYDSNRIDNTMDTLDSKTKHEYNHNEPVEIHTGGAMLSAIMLNCMAFEAYFLNADIRSRYKEEILWENNGTSNGSTGISKLNGFGMFSEYKDYFFNVLIDGAVTQKESITDNDKIKKDYGYGILYKLKFSPPFLKMTITGKEIGDSFYSPYTSSIGDDYPESAWFFDTEIKPYTNIKLITKISSQKKTAPSSADDELPVTKKEIISIAYSNGMLENIEITFKRREKTDEKKEIKKQLYLSTDIVITNFLKINFSSSYHWIDDNHESKIFRGGFQLTPANDIKINLTYIAANISDDNSVYTIISPLKDSSTPGFYITENSSAVVIKSEIKIGKIFLSGRYFYQYNKSKPLHTRLEFYASGNF